MLYIMAALLLLRIMITHSLILENLVLNRTLKPRLEGKKIGYYIGSFDPLHLGHEALVKEVLRQNLCNYLLIYPAWGGDTYKNRTDINIRLEMLFRVFQHHHNVIVTKMNPILLQNVLMQDNQGVLIAGKPTVKTILKDTEYIGIIGSDKALDSLTDKKSFSIFMSGIKVSEKYKKNTIGGIIAIPVMRFVVGLRKGDAIENLHGKICGREIIKAIETKYSDASSTKVRTLLKSGHPVDSIVSKPIVEIINQRGLFTQKTRKPTEEDNLTCSDESIKLN